MKKEIKNLPASVHQKLRNLAKQSGLTFEEVFYYHAIERFLYRLSNSQYSSSFILKGGLMFKGWGIPLRRPTRDIDVQGYQESTIDNLETIVKNICCLNVEPDGMRFPLESVRGEPIMNEADYQGIRIYFCGYLGNAFVQLHLDVSYANVITPSEIDVEYPSLLNMPTFMIRGYPYETAIAEKFQAMVALDTLNDRMKDFFDIWLLSHEVNILGSTLVKAIQATFKNRKTPLPSNLPTALTCDFAKLRQADWARFLRRSSLNLQEYPPFDEVIAVLREFLWPVVVAAVKDVPFENIWNKGGPWMSMHNHQAITHEV
jgi:hypothetical protein